MANKNLFTKFASLAMAGALAFSAVPVGGLTGAFAATTDAPSISLSTKSSIIWGGGKGDVNSPGNFAVEDLVSDAKYSVGSSAITSVTADDLEYNVYRNGQEFQSGLGYDELVAFGDGRDYGTFEIEAVSPDDASVVSGKQSFEIGARDLGTATVVGSGSNINNVDVSVEGNYHTEFNGEVQALTKNQIKSVVFASGKHDSKVTSLPLVQGTDYYYTQASGKDADTTYTGTVTGLDKRVTGAQTVYMTIDQFDLSNKALDSDDTADVDDAKKIYVDVDNAVNGGSNPGVVVKAELIDGKYTTLDEGTDYTYTCEAGGEGDDAGTAIITGVGNYTGTITKTYKIVEDKNNIAGATVTLKSGTTNLSEGGTLTYNGVAQYVNNSVVTMPNDDGKTTKTLDPTNDYRIEYEWDEKDEGATTPAWANAPINAGVVTAKFIGEGKYAGEFTATYTIEQADIDSNKTNVTIGGSYTFDGSVQEPELDKSAGITVKYDGNQIYGSNDDNNLQEYYVTYDNNVNAGTATANVMGVGNFKGVTTETFKIAQLGIGKCDIKDIANQVYVEGTTVEPALEISYKNDDDVTLDLELNSDYTVEYTNNNKIGSASAKVKGAGNYTGSTSKSFKILSAEYDIANATVVLTADSFPYDGNYHTGGVKSVSVTGTDGKVTVLTNGTDYEVSTATGKEVGTYNIVIKAKGSKYCGTVTKSFEITGYDVADAGFSLKKTSVKYNGKNQKPELVVAEGTRFDGGNMTEGVDYEVSGIKNIKNVGKLTVKVTGLGAYAGTEKSLTFKVTKADQPMKVSTKTASVKASKVAKKNQTIKASKVFSVSKNQGSVSYKKTSGNSKIKVASNGKITVKKGLKKGSYTIKVKVTAKGNSNYNSGNKTVKATIKVK